MRQRRCIITPGELVPPPRHDARSVTINGKEVSLLAALISATRPFNLTGQPALTVPCVFSNSGLPLALQIVGKPLRKQPSCKLAMPMKVTHHGMVGQAKTA